MQRDLEKINQEYQQSQVDPWGSDWRGSLALWHDFCKENVLNSVQEQFDSSTIAVLDIGCGSGILTEKLYETLSQHFSIQEYLGVDVSTAAIDKANRIFGNSSVRYMSISEDLHELQGKKFNVIFGFQFLSYLSRAERNALFSTVRSLLAPNGVAIFSSNVRTDNNEDHAYINAFTLESDMKDCFTLTKRVDLFTAQFVEKVEAKIFKFSKFPPVRMFLKNRNIPFVFHKYYVTRSTEKFPHKRMRMYILT